MWVYRSGHLYQKRQIVLYEYQQTRNASHPREFLKGYDGICVTDGYQVYHTLEKELEELTIAGCWVHCRRRFDEALKLIPKSYQKESNAFLLMKQIQAIYREEGKLNDLSSDERLKQRQAVIKPLVDAFFVYLKTINVSKKDKFGDAVGYARNQEKYLRVFLTDGDVPIDNNASERAIRGFCIGKKNWQMIDTIHGAKSSAIIYSIVETAKANNLKPDSFSMMFLAFLESKAPVGSSARIILGFRISALAAATRWRCPPDILEGNLSRTSLISRYFANWLRRWLLSFSGIPCREVGSSIFSRPVRLSSSSKF